MHAYVSVSMSLGRAEWTLLISSCLGSVFFIAYLTAAACELLPLDEPSVQDLHAQPVYCGSDPGARKDCAALHGGLASGRSLPTPIATTLQYVRTYVCTHVALLFSDHTSRVPWTSPRMSTQHQQLCQ